MLRTGKHYRLNKMCGRFAQIHDEEKLMKAFFVQTSEIRLKPNYNINPGSLLTVILEEEGLLKMTVRQWGLIPFWTKEVRKGMINGRSETVMEKPTFCHSFNRRRCVIPASGFFEWKHESESKQPFYISPKKKGILSFAGIWDQWLSPEGEQVKTCAILTCEANGLMKPIHHRMPVILNEKQIGQWLGKGKPVELKKLLKPYSSEKMQAWRVTTQVNSPVFNGPDCLVPL